MEWVGWAACDVTLLPLHDSRVCVCAESNGALTAAPLWPQVEWKCDSAPGRVEASLSACPGC